MKHKCIYCGIDKDLSESDIIPDALTNARVLNKNVCRIKHNNRFSDMFESEVIEALGFITNELDIKSSKGKKYVAYDATITIEGVDYNLKLHGDNEIFNGKVLKSSDNTHMISSYDRALKIAKDESKVEMLDVNMIEIEKKVRINNGIFFEISMYRMLSKIAFEWYCAKNDVSDHYNEFDDIVRFITTGNGINPVSIVQEEALYEMIDQEVNLGSHTLIAFEKDGGEVDVLISLFGLLMYRVVVTKKRPNNCNNNFLYTELRTDDFSKGSINQHILIIRVIDPRIRFYIHKCLCSPYYQKLIMGNVVGDKDGFSAGRCKNTLIPLPPIAEQTRIVKKMDELLGLI